MGYMVSIKETKSLAIDKNIHDFLNPDYIYVPIYEDDVILVKDNNPVDKEQAIIKRNGEFIYSTVSGTLIGKTSKMNVHNTNIECLVIENDYKEHVKKRVTWDPEVIHNAGLLFKLHENDILEVEYVKYV